MKFSSNTYAGYLFGYCGLLEGTFISHPAENTCLLHVEEVWARAVKMCSREIGGREKNRCLGYLCSWTSHCQAERGVSSPQATALAGSHLHLYLLLASSYPHPSSSPLLSFIASHDFAHTFSNIPSLNSSCPFECTPAYCWDHG